METTWRSQQGNRPYELAEVLKVSDVGCRVLCWFSRANLTEHDVQLFCYILASGFILLGLRVWIHYLKWFNSAH